MRLGFACSLPQQNHMQFMLQSGPVRATGLKRLTPHHSARHNPRKPRALPPFRRNVPEVCRKTRKRARAYAGMRLKSFN
jgi:hypothetical protein